MAGVNFRTFAFAGLLAAGALIVGINGASATPVAGSIASSGLSDIVREASQITLVRRNGGHGGGGYRGGGSYRGGYGGGRRHGGYGGGRRHGWYGGGRGYGGGPYFGFGWPYYYGGGYYPYYDGYSSGYYNDYYYRPRVRRAYRRGGSCGRAHSACVRNWGYGGANYSGCMRYEGCRRR